MQEEDGRMRLIRPSSCKNIVVVVVCHGSQGVVLQWWASAEIGKIFRKKGVVVLKWASAEIEKGGENGKGGGRGQEGRGWWSRGEVGGGGADNRPSTGRTVV